MPRLLRSALALTALVLLAGLVAAQPGEKMPETPYYPLKVGNTWSYRAGDNHFQLKVTEIKAVEGKPRAKLELIVAGKTVSHEHVAVTKDGVVRYTFEGKEAKPPIKFLEVPPKADAKWAVESKVDGQPLKGEFRAGKEEEVKVPAGTYKAVTVSGKDIDANGIKLNLTYYFAEKVGMVKQVIELAGQKIIIELERYEPGK
jgi:hypothetical protein